MEYKIANVLILFTVLADSSPVEEMKRTVLDSLSVCPPFGKKAKFEVETIQTKSLMYGCAYMGNESLLSTAPLFHLWLERPEKSFGHGHCDNKRNMDHFMFECLSKHDSPTNKDESEMGGQYISLLEHTAESMQNKTKTRSHRCALYDVYDEDDKKIRIIRMVISKPVIGEEFNASQCNGLSDLLARDLLPTIPEGHRYWPDGSMYIYLLGRKAKIFYPNTKNPESPVMNRPTTATSQSTTTTTRRPIITTITTTNDAYPSVDYYDRDRTQTILDRTYWRVCPPLGNSKFEVQTLQTTSLMFGCAYMESLQAYVTLFHLWLERPDKRTVHGNCDNMQNMDHFMFECLSKLVETLPTDQDEFEMGWQYISLLEHTAESMQNKTKTRIYRCALYAVNDQDYNMVRSIHMVISKPVIGEQFDVSQCNGLLDIMARDKTRPNIPEGYRYWPDGSLYIYLLGRKTTIFVTNPSSTTTTRRPLTTTTTSRPSTTTTTSRPSTTTTTEKYRQPSWFFFPDYYLHYI